MDNKKNILTYAGLKKLEDELEQLKVVKRKEVSYMTQVAVKPPTFVIFVNDKELMHFSYTRYLENKIRDAFDFGGTPLKLIVRERGEKE